MVLCVGDNVGDNFDLQYTVDIIPDLRPFH